MSGPTWKMATLSAEVETGVGQEGTGALGVESGLLKVQVFCWLLFLIQLLITWESLKRKMVPETVLGLGGWSPVEDDGAL